MGLGVVGGSGMEGCEGCTEGAVELGGREKGGQVFMAMRERARGLGREKGKGGRG